jgi:hypothetical protein
LGKGTKKLTYEETCTHATGTGLVGMGTGMAENTHGLPVHFTNRGQTKQ